MGKRALVLLATWPDRQAALADAVQRAWGLSLPGPGRACRATGSGNPPVALWVGPMRWWIAGAASWTADLVGDAALVDLGEARVVIRIEGAGAMELLACILPLDLDATAFPIDGCAQSVYAGVGVLLHRIADAGFELYVPSSYAASLWEQLTAHPG
jgi:sarcosine oxidase subunit gamma